MIGKVKKKSNKLIYKKVQKREEKK